MKTIYKFFLLALTFFSSANPQIRDISILSVQNTSQPIEELTSDLLNKADTILNEFNRADRYEISFNSAGLASGVYIYRMKVNDLITSKKMLLIK
jgi:hypothetical protein